MDLGNFVASSQNGMLSAQRSENRMGCCARTGQYRRAGQNGMKGKLSKLQEDIQKREKNANVATILTSFAEAILAPNMPHL